MTIEYSVLASSIFLCLFLLVAVAISGYLGIASHYIVRDKNCADIEKIAQLLYPRSRRCKKLFFFFHPVLILGWG